MRLSSDNPNTMPITDAVYGRPPKRKPAADKPRRPQRRTIEDALLAQGWAAALSTPLTPWLKEVFDALGQD